MKRAAAEAIAGLVTSAELKRGTIVPSPLDRRVGFAVALATAGPPKKPASSVSKLDEAELIKRIKSNLNWK